MGVYTFWMRRKLSFPPTNGFMCLTESYLLSRSESASVSPRAWWLRNQMHRSWIIHEFPGESVKKLPKEARATVFNLLNCLREVFPWPLTVQAASLTEQSSLRGKPQQEMLKWAA